MVQLSFITPAALALLILLPLIWALVLWAPRRLPPFRFWSSLVLRSIALIALVLALAGTQFVWPVRSVTTIFLVDVSDSIAPLQRDRAFQFVEQALRQMAPGNQAGIVIFGENALVERTPASLATLGRVTSAPITARTNIEDAVQLGLVLLPGDTQKRLVLLSDGGENSGVAAEAARLAAIRDVPLDVVNLSGERGPDVILQGIAAPQVAREGQDVTINVEVDSGIATSGQLQVFADGQLISEQSVAVVPGRNSYPVTIRTGDAGFRRLEARLLAEGDSTAQNNRAAAFTEVQGPPRLLLIAADPARAANLRDALTAAAVRVDLRTPASAPASLDQLSDYAGVVLVDTAARDLPRALIENLPVYVRELGRGMAMIGGVDSFGAGGYRRTRIEEILPVSLDPMDSQLQPDLALVMVIDRSGSMTERPADAGGRTKLDLAKEAVYQASLGLAPQDQIGLVAFDSVANWVVNLQPLPQPVEIEQALSRFDANGGTDIRAGLVLASDAVVNANAKIKHVILLTDGIADSNYAEIVEQLRQSGATISTVAVGADANPNLETIALQGGGRFYKVTRVEDVPRIFLQETVIVAGRDLVEGQVEPQVALPAPVVRGLTSLPALYGYNGTELRSDSRAILVTPDNKPILAQRQVGLGRTVAWTSDVQGKWARDWVSWSEFVRFVGGFADMLLPPRVTERLNLQATNQGSESVLELTAQDAQGRPLNGLTLTGSLIDPENNRLPTQFIQIGPGRYRAVAPTSASGVYLSQVSVTDAQGNPLGSATTGLVVSYSPEYSVQAANPKLLTDLAQLTNGLVDLAPEAAFSETRQRVGAVTEIGLALLWLALLLWPLDIALRRLSLRRSDLTGRVAALRRPKSSSSSAPPELANLSAAKQRARRGRGSDVPRDPTTPVVMATTDQNTPAVRPTPPAVGAPPPAEPARQEADADTMARLLAAKRRARTGPARPANNAGEANDSPDQKSE